MKAADVSIVLLSAVLLSVDAVMTEAVMSSFHVGPLVVSSLPGLVSGAMLFLASYRRDKRFYRKFGRKDMVKIFSIAVLGGLAVFSWFDSVRRIGAGKEMLLGGSTSETLLIILLSFVFLRERLSKSELAGSALVLLGIFFVSFDPRSASLLFGFGEMEAVAGALFFASSIVITTSMLKKFDVQEVGALYLTVEGMLLLASALLFESPAGFSVGVIGSSMAIGIVVGLAVLTYNTGLKRAGASLTGVVSSFTGLFTVGAQFLAGWLLPSVAFIFPHDIATAVAGGLLAVFGVFLISCKNK